MCSWMSCCFCVINISPFVIVDKVGHINPLFPFNWSSNVHSQSLQELSLLIVVYVSLTGLCHLHNAWPSPVGCIWPCFLPGSRHIASLPNHSRFSIQRDFSMRNQMLKFAMAANLFVRDHWSTTSNAGYAADSPQSIWTSAMLLFHVHICSMTV